MNVALVGDSTLDNAAYTSGGPAVTDQLRVELGESHSVSLVARDGDITRDVPHQLRSMPGSTTHIVLSVGGNDALAHLDLLSSRVATVGEAMSELGRALSQFEGDYRRCLREVVALGRPTIVCAIYNGNFLPDERGAIECTARLFNDVIIQAASDAGCTILDLRRVCVDRSDFFNPIEANTQGGAKIARGLGELLLAETPPGIFPHRRDMV
ncbi:MAG: SGNH/GDSL hydrolase family protein [Gemmatimonadetes bacterium]|nr:SGNH/GDSL hydrolase family protein [Gemmatimonadota bacterium]